MNKINSLSGYFHEHQKSLANPASFWAQQADSFFWRKRWTQDLDWSFNPFSVKWFVDGKLNITENIFERHMYTHANKPAIIWEPNNPGEPSKTFTYKELYLHVCRMANALIKNGIKRGDRVAIYMPMVPELTIAMLACARIGAIHMVVFAGFSAEALAERINDSQAKLLITSNESFRGGKIIKLKEIVDESLTTTPSIERVIVHQRTENKTHMKKGRDFWWSDETSSVPTENQATIMDSESPLFILYTSGSTGKPKGVVHTTGGYMVYACYSFINVFQYHSEDIHFCSADIGWITGHSYIVYGPLLAGGTSVIFEGIPTYPDAGRYWDIIEKHGVTHFYTAPTAIRSLMAYELKFVKPERLKSIRVLGTVGEPINSEAWNWYHTHIGNGRCPIVDTWWQTETGGIVMSPLAGIIPTKPTFATLPLPGIQPIILNDDGKELTGNSVEGYLCIKFPWPGMLRTIWGNHDRCEKTYFKTFEGYYFTGDGVKRDEDGYYRILGRVDDVINVSGHRFGTAEIENAINRHPAVTESAVIGYPHPIKGEGIMAFVVIEQEEPSQNLHTNIMAGVTRGIGPIAKPDKIYFVYELPKTRSGKIMRRILRKIVEGERVNFGDTTTMLNPDVIQLIIEKIEHEQTLEK